MKTFRIHVEDKNGRSGDHFQVEADSEAAAAADALADYPEGWVLVRIVQQWA